MSLPHERARCILMILRAETTSVLVLFLTSPLFRLSSLHSGLTPLLSASRARARAASCMIWRGPVFARRRRLPSVNSAKLIFENDFPRRGGLAERSYGDNFSLNTRRICECVDVESRGKHRRTRLGAEGNWEIV